MQAIVGSEPHPCDYWMMATAAEAAAIDAQLAKLQEIWDKDLPAFNQKIREANVQAIGFAPEKAERAGY